MSHDISMSDLRTAFRGFVARERTTKQIPGRLGRPDGGASYTFTVPGGLGFTYVRVFQGDGMTLAKARNTAGVAETGDTPIWLDIDRDGQLCIVGTRWEGS